jgi:hypothetical protein
MSSPRRVAVVLGVLDDDGHDTTTATAAPNRPHTTPCIEKVECVDIIRSNPLRLQQHTTDPRGSKLVSRVSNGNE